MNSAIELLVFPLLVIAIGFFFGSAFMRPRTFAYLFRPVMFTCAAITALSMTFAAGAMVGARLAVDAMPSADVTEAEKNAPITQESLEKGMEAFQTLIYRSAGEAALVALWIALGACLLAVIAWLLVHPANRELQLIAEREAGAAPKARASRSRRSD